jgi:hypothetical protein
MVPWPRRLTIRKDSETWGGLAAAGRWVAKIVVKVRRIRWLLELSRPASRRFLRPA